MFLITTSLCNFNTEQPIAMTAPVITGPAPSEGQKIAMTTPVVTTTDYMQFVLPAEFKRLEDIPSPTNSNVQLRSVPGKLVAVHRFSGAFSESYFHDQLQRLYDQLLKENIIADHHDAVSTPVDTTVAKKASSLPDHLTWSFAQYNPPFALPFLRRNEVWIELKDEDRSDKLRSLLSQQSGEQAAVSSK